MKKSRFTETQIVAILKEADAGVVLKDLWRKHGISSATYYSWKAKYGGLDASQLKRLKELEGELGQAQADVRGAGARELRAEGSDRKKALRPSERRSAAEYLVSTHELAVVRACRSVGLSKSAYYEPPIDWVSRDRELIEALRSLADSHPRRGFWKYYKMLRRAGRAWNHKRLYRVYCEMKLNHRRRAKQRVPIREPQPRWFRIAPTSSGRPTS